MWGQLGLATLAVAFAALTLFIIGWGVKQIWTWKEPMSTPAKLVPEIETPAWAKALENFLSAIFSPIFQIIGGIIGVVFMIGVGILGLYLFLVLLKFLWERA